MMIEDGAYWPGPLLELLRDETEFRFRTDPGPDCPRISIVETRLVAGSEWALSPESHDRRWIAKPLSGVGMVLAVRLTV